MAGSQFNINSPKQLSQILFHDLGLPAQHKTKTGVSTDSDALEALAPFHPIAEKLLEYRQLTKLLNTYIDVLPTLMDKNHRIHTTFNITVAATGRLSSSDPNIQNIPIRTEMGERIRRAFVAQPGYCLVVADYSQIELRILAHLSADENLIAAFLAGHDIHTSTASQVFKIPYEEITPSVRRRAKEINFGIAYGMKAFGLAQRLGIPQKEAAAFIETYFAAFPKIQTILDATIAHVREYGWVGTMLGRKRFFPNYATASKKDQQSLDRMIINTPFQGSAADIIKAAMLTVEEKLRPLKAKMILQIHDELIIECPPSEVDQVKAILKTEMEKVAHLVVPLTVNIGVGQNWLEAK
jgi:DNA polymerase-1